ncbi:MAG: YopT-type cysteine protease domain-containing protein [Legionella sp.]|uniref:YopT-type cysteine protease domain-containing protein n=1 Tax=Legionella sp. TaxID=459 RepID=UPI00284295E2|nr:YopT-type cysteine protease domain-containing protein [Legionella sp.]
MLQRLKRWLSSLETHYEFISRTYDRYQRTLKKETTAFTQANSALLERAERAERASGFQDIYLDMHQQHKQAFDNVKANIPSSKFVFLLRYFFNSSISFIMATTPLETSINTLEEVSDANKKEKPLIDLWQDSEQNLQPFDQMLLTGKYTDFEQKGICDGLLSEWTRFYTKYPHGEMNFIEKLTNKLRSTPTPENFIARVQRLQTEQIFHKKQDKDFYFVTNERRAQNNKNATPCASIEEIITQTINYFNEHEQNNLVVMDCREIDLGLAHAVGIRCERNSAQEIERYVFYDPNYGELTFKGKNKEHDLQQFFLTWSKNLFMAMTPSHRQINPTPNIQITLETHSKTSRINLLDEKKKEALINPNVRQKTPSPQQNEPREENETSADNDIEMESRLAI